MTQKYTDSYTKNGYWGVDILVSIIDHPVAPKHRVLNNFIQINEK